MVLALDLGTKIHVMFFYFFSMLALKNQHTLLLLKKTFKYLKFIGGFG